MFYWRRLFFVIRSSFWFLPGLMAIVAVVSAILFAEYDFGFNGGPGFERVSEETGMPVDSARAILSTIAGSMITVTTLVFSMTLVAMTLVAQQLGPRIVLRFMDNRPTQIFLGLFLATFLFALIVLVRIGYADADGQVPNIAILLSTGLVILSMGAIIAFIQNVASRIQADELVGELGNEFQAAARQLVQRGGADKAFASEAETADIRELFKAHDVVQVPARYSGYLNVLDEQAALAFLEENDLVARVLMHPGEFVLEGTNILEVAMETSKDGFDEKVVERTAAMISVLAKRTAELTLEFEVNALTEVALRALSPGINDPYTARACIHRLGTGLRELLDHPGQPAVTRDGEGRIRIVHHQQPFGYYCSLALRPLMNAGRDHAEVLSEIADMLGSLGGMAARQDRRDEISELLDALEQTVGRSDLIKVDQALVMGRIEAARNNSTAVYSIRASSA